ncbi:MAG TPA: hypothetical protein VE549_06660 [Myxococcaceae bacterium]|nr:hypothetical protein [Myxococcaceae bacterium]
MSDEAALPLPSFAPHEKVCGNCKLWRPYSVDHRGWVGPCRLQPNRGHFPPSAPICDYFAPKGIAAAAPAPRPEAPRAPRPRSVAPTVIRRERERRLDQTVELGGLEDMTREELMDLFREAAGDVDSPPLAAKWQGGVVQILPGNRELQGKEVSIDSLLHKIVMIRDRLRTLEQKINAHPKLSDAEKVEMQHYVTRVYGSLTTFNALFRDKADQFVGQKGDE